ncbi:putative tetrahydrofolylpolyglutamate synthase [Calycina marina]|uniref:tetrahydrofolate synthase n=1 Tax=Calycina marina TaxID=1763456 RepID=A0A9P7Z6M7_9HELO|nr:putative tetrahydrofolylpolyglutamate synthase [Calycina marina]
MDRSFKRAIKLLNIVKRPARPKINPPKDILGLETANIINKSNVKGVPSLFGMIEWLSELGHSMDDINNLNVIHVAGTKGKGSTCAFIDSFLRTHGNRTGFPRKVGLYTSPHLVEPQERIRINFRPLLKDIFAKNFFEIDDTLSKNVHNTPRPRRLQLFALLAFHTFIKEGVDAAVIETHHGGEYDSTNFVKKPVATVVTSLGLDHTKQLGSTIDQIAWHKAGIFKPGVPAFSPPQEPEAAEMLQKRASEKNAKLNFVADDHDLPENVTQLTPDVQRTNASVAMAAVRSFLDQRSNPKALIYQEDIQKGIKQFKWPGRFQIVDQGDYQWYFDSAHNEMSVEVAAKCDSLRRLKVVIFSLLSDQRDGTKVVEALGSALKKARVKIDHIIFTTYVRDPGNTPEERENTILPIIKDKEMAKLIREYEICWRKNNCQNKSSVGFELTIRDALQWGKGVVQYTKHADLIPRGAQILVTGSQHLVGTALDLMMKDDLLENSTTPEVKEELFKENYEWQAPIMSNMMRRYQIQPEAKRLKDRTDGQNVSAGSKP